MLLQPNPSEWAWPVLAEGWRPPAGGPGLQVGPGRQADSGYWSFQSLLVGGQLKRTADSVMGSKMRFLGLQNCEEFCTEELKKCLKLKHAGEKRQEKHEPGLLRGRRGPEMDDALPRVTLQRA